MLPLAYASKWGSITDIDGILVGHHHRLDLDATLGAGWATGSTVVRRSIAATVSPAAAAVSKHQLYAELMTLDVGSTVPKP